MGFSLKKLLEGATAQVNPFDKGRTFSTVQRGVAPTPQPARTPPPQGRPQQSFGNRFRDVFDANTQSDIYRRTQKNQVPIFENPGNLLTKSQDVAGSIAKPLVRVPMATPLFARNVAAKIQGNAPLTGEQFYGKTVANATGFTGSGRQALGDTATNAINIGIPGSGKLLSGGISKGITSVAPRVAPHVPKIIPKVIGTSGTGAVLGGPSNVASLIGEDSQPITRQNVGQAYKAGTVGGMAFGAAIPIAGVAGRGAVRAAPIVAKQSVKAAKAVPPAVRSVEDKVTMPRVNIEEQNILRDYSDYLAGAYKPQGKDLSDLIGQTRIVGQRHGVDLTNGSPDEQLARSTGILDHLGQQRDSVAQGGYARVPGRQVEPVGEDDFFQKYKPTMTQTDNQKFLLPEQRINQAPLPTLNTKLVPKRDKAFRSTRSIIERQGESGKELAGMVRKSRDVEELYQANLLRQLPTVRELAKSSDKLVGTKKAEFENFVNATQGIEAPKNSRVAQAIKEWQGVHPEIRNRAVAAGLDVGDLGPNYYPHFIDYDKVYKDKNTFNEAINHLVKSGQAPNTDEAIKLLGYARDVSRNRRMGNLEASRLVDLPMYDKTPNSLTSYLQGSSKRIAQTETFGKQDEKALKLISGIGKEGFDTESAKMAFDVASGAKQYSPTATKAAGNIRKYLSTTRLGLGAITNTSQSVNTGIVTGHMRTAGAMLKQLNPKTREFVEKTGTVADAVINDIRENTGFTGKVLSKITAPGFGKVEKFNRSVAAVAGRDYAQSLARKGDVKTLQKLGVTGKIGKQLSDEQQIQAARRIVEKTQFKVDPQDLPGWVDTPQGKLISQFRTFSYNQSKFFSNEILKPLARGNVMPLARLLAALPIGYGLMETKRALNARPEPDRDTLGKIRTGVETFGNVGGAGLVMDVFRSMVPLNNKYLPSDRRVSMAVGTFGGPAASTGAEVVGALSEVAQKKNTPDDNPNLEGKVAIKSGDGYFDATQLSRFGLRQIPAIGTRLQNTYVPYKPKDTTQTASNNEKVDLTRDQLEKYKLMTEADKKSYVDQVVNQQQTNKEKDALQKGKSVTPKVQAAGPPAGNSDIKKLSSGKFYAKVGNEFKTFDDEKEAQTAIAKDKFKETGKKSALVGDLYFYKTKSGSIESKTKQEYDDDKFDARSKLELDRAKNRGDYSKWIDITNQKVDRITKQIEGLDPVLDQAEIDKLTLEGENLIEQAMKYQSQGGFTKGKSGKGRKGGKFVLPSITANQGATLSSLNSLLRSAKVSGPKTRRKR